MVPATAVATTMPSVGHNPIHAADLDEQGDLDQRHEQEQEKQPHGSGLRHLGRNMTEVGPMNRDQRSWT
jgi:hypothetical protein